MLKNISIFIISFFITFSIFGQNKVDKYEKNQMQFWADSILTTLSTKEKIAQLLCVRINTDISKKEIDIIDDLIENYGIGGICFFKGTTENQIELTNRWQTKSKIPLFVSIDGESGVGMRLTDVNKFPLATTLGAITNDSVVYYVGKEIGKQCRALGIQINFAPVVDVNTNPENPVIGLRSFGENSKNVSKKAIAYFKGMQDMGIIAVAKHFPGHGDTKSDSHFQLPLINSNFHRLNKIELFPFKECIQNDISGIMIGHLSVPALDSTGVAASISKPMITNLLKSKLDFNGLVITDGLDMKGITNSTKEGETELKAFLAGNDILLLPRNPIAAINTIAEAIENNEISINELNDRCKKVLFFKIKNGINQYNFIEKEKAIEVLNHETTKDIIKNAYENAITILVNNNAIPLNMNIINQISVITYGEDNSGFCNMLNHFAPFNTIKYDSSFNNSEIIQDSIIIVAVFAGNSKEGKYGINSSYLKHIQKISQNKNVILCLFASPYSISLFKEISMNGIIIGYENNKYAGDAVAQVLCGIIPSRGKLPISSGDFKEGDGIDIKIHQNLTFSSPNSLNINELYLKKIDSLAQLGIDSKAYPGCQILIAKDGKVFYDKSFGYSTYDIQHKVLNSNLYDVASLTKILATTPAIMLLSDQGKIDIDKNIGYYLPELKNTNKEKLVIRDILAHQAKLKSWIPFYKIYDTISCDIYSKIADENHTIKIADSLFMLPEYQDTLFSLIIQSDLITKNQYLYSDLGMILLYKIIEKITNQKFDEFVSENFYKKMNLATIGFNPLHRFNKSVIIPTELDTVWRNQLIQGNVHDMAAAMLNGVSGNAGVFSNAWDVASMMQFFLQNGKWNDFNYIKGSTIKEFTSTQFPLDDNRRGLGFDKPLTKYNINGQTCKSASMNSFGHTGFTGCFAWADPDNNLIVVFLSNRIYPDINNSKLSKMNIRTQIQQNAYNALE